MSDNREEIIRAGDKSPVFPSIRDFEHVSVYTIPSLVDFHEAINSEFRLIEFFQFHGRREIFQIFASSLHDQHSSKHSVT